MDSTNEARGSAQAVAPARRRGRGRTGWIALLLAATGGVAWATEDEKYPDHGDDGVEARVSAWKSAIPGYTEALCTGRVTRSDSQSTRDPAETTSNVPQWTPIGDAGFDVPSVIERRRGGDTDDLGTDSFLFVKLVGVRANLFATVILEAEDGARSEWKVRYRGTETVSYENGPIQRGDVLEVKNPWSIAWTRRVIDFDARAGEYDEEKEIRQKFAVRCDLIDGTSVGDGFDFHRVVPLTESSTTGVPLKLKAGFKAGDAPAGEGGVEAGFELSTTKTYDTKFSEETVSSEPLEGVATVTTTAPCPETRAWTIATEFDADLSVVDHETFNGDKGARQELRLTVLNGITTVRVSGCHDCGTPPPPPIDPRAPLPPTTPRDPLVPDPTTPSLPVRPVTPTDPVLPTGPVVTPRAGEEPGFLPGPSLPLAPFVPLGGARPLVGPDEPPPSCPPIDPAPWLPTGRPDGTPPTPSTLPVAIVAGAVRPPTDGSTDEGSPR